MQLTRYDTDLTDAAWELVAPLLPEARPGGRPRTTDIRAVVDAILYLLRTGCQWRLLPREFPAWGTVLFLFPELGEPGRVDQPAKDDLRANAPGSRAGTLSLRSHYG